MSAPIYTMMASSLLALKDTHGMHRTHSGTISKIRLETNILFTTKRFKRSCWMLIELLGLPPAKIVLIVMFLKSLLPPHTYIHLL